MERNPDMAGTGWLRDSVIYQIFMPSFADAARMREYFADVRRLTGRLLPLNAR